MPGRDRIWRRSKLAAFLPRLYADDIFISYSRADASVYAFGLAEELGRRGFACFIDQWGTVPGLELPPSLVRRLTSCTVCVLVATPAALASVAVRQEIETYKRTTRPIIPIRFDEVPSGSPLETAIAGLAVSYESRETLDTGTPSARIIARVEKSFTYTRRNERMRRLVGGASAVLLVLLAAIAWAGWTARNEVRRAAEQTAIADAATQDAVRQKQIAGQARSETTAQAALAARAKADARDQQERAAASAREAEAQQRLASFRRALADAELERNQGDDRILNPPRKGLEAYRQYPSAEADALLRYGLDRLPQLKATLIHPASVTDSVISRDGQFVSTVDAEATARMWNVAGSRVVAEYRYDKKVSRVLLSRDGEHLVIVPSRDAADRRIVSVVALRGPQEIARLEHNAAIVDACFSGNGNYLATASLDGAIRVWQLTRPGGGGSATAVTSVDVIRAEQKSFDEIALSDDGRLIALIEETAEEDDDIPDERTTIFRVAPAAKLLETRGRPTFSGRGRFFGYSHRDTVWIKTLQDPPRSVGRNVEGGRVNAVAFDPQDSLVATAGDDGRVKIYDLANEAQELLRLDHRERATDVQFTRVGEMLSLITITGDGTAHLWLPSLRRTMEDRQTRYVEAMKIYGPSKISRISASSDGRYFAASGQSNYVIVWEKMFHGGVAGFFPDGPVRGGTISRDLRYLTVTTGRTEYRWDTVDRHVEERPVERDVRPQPATLRRILGTSRDGRYAAGVASADDRRLDVIQSASGARVATLAIDAAPDRVSFSPDGRYFVVSTSKKGIAIHETVGGRLILQPLSALFSPDSALFVVRTDARTVNIHELPSGRPVARHTAPSEVRTVWWSPEGRVLAIHAGSLWLWNRVERRLHPVDLQIDRIANIAASPNETSLAIADADGTVWIVAVADRSLAGPFKHGTLVRGPLPAPQRTAPNGSIVVTGRTESGDPATVSKMTFTTDDRYFAVVATIGRKPELESGTVMVWDVRRRALATRIEHEYSVQDLAFTSDSRHLVVVGEHRIDQLLWMTGDLAAALDVRLAELSGFRPSTPGPRGRR